MPCPLPLGAMPMLLMASAPPGALADGKRWPELRLSRGMGRSGEWRAEERGDEGVRLCIPYRPLRLGGEGGEDGPGDGEDVWSQSWVAHAGVWVSCGETESDGG